jgi:uncharacterized protein YecE (DUF72 family)
LIRIGCSGWQYQHWRDEFYPAELPQLLWFAHYVLSFDTVEINNSFYRLPEAGTFAKWRDQAPKRFLYAVKASRFLTHMKKLRIQRNRSRVFSICEAPWIASRAGVVPIGSALVHRPPSLRTLSGSAASWSQAYCRVPGDELV